LKSLPRRGSSHDPLADPVRDAFLTPNADKSFLSCLLSATCASIRNLLSPKIRSGGTIACIQPRCCKLNGGDNETRGKGSYDRRSILRSAGNYCTGAPEEGSSCHRCRESDTSGRVRSSLDSPGNPPPPICIISHSKPQTKPARRSLITYDRIPLQTTGIQLWPFRKAPSRLRALFREGKDPDWLANVTHPAADIVDPYFDRLKQLYPVSSVRLPDESVVYWGAPREAISVIASRYTQPSVAAFPPIERRNGVRVPLSCAMWYETSSMTRKRREEGRVIDISSSGVAFTTESPLRRNTRVALHIQWPVRLEGEVPVELFASGKVVRTEQSRTALQYDQINFNIL
jgi:PilZ domain